MVFMQQTQQCEQKVLVIGAGRSGRAAVRLLLALNMQVTLLESNTIAEDFLQEIQEKAVRCILDTMKTEYFADVDIIIPSPGVPIAKIKDLLPENSTATILAEMEFAARHLQGEAILAITGTSGKTTTVSLAADMLTAGGKNIFLGGNIGTPLSEYVLARLTNSAVKADVLVLEVSSFQLQGCVDFAPRVAVLLNITENHLDYHADLDEYITAKMQIFAKQNASDVAIFPKKLKDFSGKYTIKSQKMYFSDHAENFQNRQLFGKHNDMNIEAAWLACSQFGISLEAAQRAVADFKPIAHRLEKIRELHNVLYVNDSKCTTVDAMRVAIDAFDRPIILLCGGKFKGGDLQSLRTKIQEKVKAVLLFGASREYFEQAWSDCVPMHWFASLSEAIQEGKNLAVAGDVVLMAPATASYDLYANYIQRGEDFRHLVEELL